MKKKISETDKLIERIDMVAVEGLTVVDSMYSILSKVYDLFVDINKGIEEKKYKEKKVLARIKIQISVYTNIKEDSKNIATALVRYVMGGLGKQIVSKYSLSIKKAFKNKEEVEKLGFVDWIKTMGGVSGTQNSSDDKIDMSTVVLKNIDKFLTHYTFPFSNLDPTKVNVSNGEVFVMIAKRQNDNVLIKSVISGETKSNQIKSTVRPLYKHLTADLKNWKVLNKKEEELLLVA
jgi:hypothetical protein